MTKYTKGIFRMKKAEIELEGVFSPWLRFCIGLAIVLLAVTPLVAVLH